jgi:hypothetical protein
MDDNKLPPPFRPEDGGSNMKLVEGEVVDGNSPLEPHLIDLIYGQRVTKITVTTIPSPDAKELQKRTNIPAELLRETELTVYLDNNLCYIYRVSGVLVNRGDALADVKPTGPYYHFSDGPIESTESAQ